MLNIFSERWLCKISDICSNQQKFDCKVIRRGRIVIGVSNAGSPGGAGLWLCQGCVVSGKQSDVSEKLRCITNLELRQKNLWFSWRNLLSENLRCMWSLLLCVDGEFDLRRRLLGSSCRVCMHHAHKHSQCNLFAFVLFVIAKIIGLVVLCFRYQ